MHYNMSKNTRNKGDLALVLLSTVMGIMIVMFGFSVTQLTDTNPSDVVAQEPMPIWTGVLTAMVFYVVWGVGLTGGWLCHERNNRLLLRHAIGWPVTGYIAWHNGPEPILAKVDEGN